MRRYRIKIFQREDIDAWLNTPYMDVAPRYHVFAVQMRVGWWWRTIKEFEDHDAAHTAYTWAQILLEELNRKTY